MLCTYGYPRSDNTVSEAVSEEKNIYKRESERTLIIFGTEMKISILDYHVKKVETEVILLHPYVKLIY